VNLTEGDCAYMLCAIHPYNLERQIGNLSIIWQDAERIIPHFGTLAIFGMNRRPQKASECLQSLQMILDSENQYDIFKPSEMVELFHAHTTSESDVSNELRSLQKLAMQKIKRDAGLGESDTCFKKPSIQKQIET